MSATIVDEDIIPMLGPGAAGTRLTAKEFDQAEFVEGWRYELIEGVLVVNPAPLPQERGPNERLGHWLLQYQEFHPQGKSLTDTLPEHDIQVKDQRRRADRAIWIGLSHPLDYTQTPTIAVEFVSKGKRNWLRDYEQKRNEYAEIGIEEYWVINRFKRTLTVFAAGQSEKLLEEQAIYQTPLLPGFELSLAKLLAVVDRYAGRGDREDD